jgi:hypothetical protein
MPRFGATRNRSAQIRLCVRAPHGEHEKSYEDPHTSPHHNLNGISILAPDFQAPSPARLTG